MCRCHCLMLFPIHSGLLQVRSCVEDPYFCEKWWVLGHNVMWVVVDYGVSHACTDTSIVLVAMCFSSDKLLYVPLPDVISTPSISPPRPS